MQDSDFDQKSEAHTRKAPSYKKRRRKLAGEPTKVLNIVIRAKYYDALEALAGSNSFGYQVEKLIHNADRRAAKKAKS